MDTYTMQDWQRDRTLKPKIGQVLEPKVYHQLRNCMPPKNDGKFFQMGEAYTHENSTALYMTFERVVGSYYKYIGLKP